MKKIGFLATAALAAVIGLSSCQGARENMDESISNKIENKQTLTSTDYTRMIEYVGEYAEKAQKYLDMQILDTQSTEAKEGLAQLNEEYPFVDEFRKAIATAPLTNFSEDNLNLIQKYAGYLEFSAPAGFNIQTNPEAAGMEVEAPDVNPDSTAVVAGAVDTEVIKR